MALSKIMAVLDPTLDQQPAFERALDSAEITGASLHLYICINGEYGDGERDDVIAVYAARLDALADRARNRDIDVECEIEWDDHWRRRVVQAGQRCSADLIIKHSVDHSDVDRAKRRTADWTLLRSTSCPVLMIKDHTQWQERRVLAAILDKPADDVHRKLNEQVIAFSSDFAESYDSDAHFVIAYHDRNHAPDPAELARRCRVEQTKVHVVHGETDKVITDTARRIGAELIVIGTAGRTGIKGAIVGNTSERLLDHTQCDVLVLH